MADTFDRFIADQVNKTSDTTSQLGRKGIGFSTLPSFLQDVIELWDCRNIESTQEEGTVFVVGHPTYSIMGPSTTSGAMPIGPNVSTRTTIGIFNAHNFFPEYFDNDRFISAGSSTGSWSGDLTFINDSVGYYPFNGNANDESGNGYTGSVTGATLSTDYLNNSNQAYYFNGTNQNVSISTGLDITGTAISIFAWVKLDSLTNTFYQIFEKGNPGSNGYLFRIRNTPQLDFRFNNISSSYAYSFVVDTWYHVGVTYDGANVKFYINGEYKDSDARTDSISSTSDTAYIGTRTAALDDWEGNITDVILFDTTLSDADVGALYSETKSSRLEDNKIGEYYLGSNTYLQTDYIAYEDKIYKSLKININSEYVSTGSEAISDLEATAIINGSNYTLSNNIITSISNFSTDGLKIKINNLGADNIKLNRFTVVYEE